MQRVILTEEGQWIDTDTSEVFEEDTWHDGHNFVSKATGDQWEHEALYHTERGAWVLHSWSQRQGTPATYRRVTEEFAHIWMLRNGHTDRVPDDVVDSLQV